MDTEQKGRGAKRSGNSTEPTVAGDSMQSKPPGAQQSGSASVQSATAEEGSGALRDRAGLDQQQPAAAQGTTGSRQSGGQASQARADAGSKQTRYDDTIEGKQTRYDSTRNRGGS